MLLLLFLLFLLFWGLVGWLVGYLVRALFVVVVRGGLGCLCVCFVLFRFVVVCLLDLFWGFLIASVYLS